MRSNSKRLIAICVAVAAVGIFAWTLVHALYYAPDQEVNNPALAASAPIATASSSALPERLMIPSLHIDANVQKVGLTAQNNMGIPSNFTDVAWYKYGTIPGQKGSAVIDGHVDNGLALAGVFKHLVDIKNGDDVYVQQADGSKLHFIVVDIQSYPYKAAPSDTIFNQRDAARLNLITCEGVWVKGDRTYDHRLVVFTKLVNSL
jgi:sortase A